MSKIFQIFSVFLVIYSVTSLGGATALHAQGATGEATSENQASESSERSLKHKVAIARFTNETRYGRTLLRDSDLDPLGKQASDILAAYLNLSDKFLILERTDLSEIQREQSRTDSENGVVGADVLILGSVVEFGRTTRGQRGLFNRKKVQVAHAKVAIRLIDVKTGLVFHSATGEGDSETETRTVLGIGSTSDFDATLSDRAISAAVEDVIDELVSTLDDRPWQSDILLVEDGRVYFAGGESQGVQVGDRFYFVRAGQTIQSKQTGFDITLPAEVLGQLEVVSLFGQSETNEGAVATIISGELPEGQPENIYVVEEVEQS